MHGLRHILSGYGWVIVDATPGYGDELQEY